MKPRQRKPARKPAKSRRWPLARLWQTYRPALCVYEALAQLYAERPGVLTPTRGALSDATGINRPPTISRALAVLHEARWIDCTHVPVFRDGDQAATLLRIVLRAPYRTLSVPNGGAPVKNTTCNDPRARKEHVVFRPPLREEGGPHVPALPPPDGGRAGTARPAQPQSPAQGEPRARPEQTDDLPF